jgi:4-alpha-glucanotransferase
MKTHNLRRMWVMHYELAGHSRRLLPDSLPNQVASLNTHDMPPFASFWRGQDIIDRLRTGILTSSEARREKASRAVLKGMLVIFLRKRGLLGDHVTARSVLQACISFVAASRSPLALVNLEDLWLETHMQNIPSTASEHPNWRHKAKHDFKSFCQMPQVMAILEILRALRSGGKGKGVSAQ